MSAKRNSLQMELVWEAQHDPKHLHQIPDGGTFIRLRGSTIYAASDAHEKRGGVRKRACLSLPAGKLYWFLPDEKVRPKPIKVTVKS